MGSKRTMCKNEPYTWQFDCNNFSIFKTCKHSFTQGATYWRVYVCHILVSSAQRAHKGICKTKVKLNGTEYSDLKITHYVYHARMSHNTGYISNKKIMKQRLRITNTWVILITENLPWHEMFLISETFETKFLLFVSLV